MGKTFRKDSSHNKYNRRDRDAKQKFSKKFLIPKRSNSFKPPTPEITEPEEE